LQRGLFEGVLPLAFGLAGTMAVAIVIALRIPSWPILLWATVAVALVLAHPPVVAAGRRALAAGQAPLLAPYAFVSLGWTASMACGALLAIAGGDPRAAALAILSVAAVVGGFCLRNWAAPRLAAAMSLAGLVPCALAAFVSGEPMLMLLVLVGSIHAVGALVGLGRLHKVMLRALHAEQQGEQKARQDPVTGLLNRAGLARSVNRRIEAAEPAAIFLVNLDGFRAINDAFGHRLGDALLKSVGERLEQVCAPDDSIARLEGDEFVVVRAGDAAAALDFGGNLVRSVAQARLRIGNEVAVVSASIGVALCPDHGRDLGSLLGEADAALYQAKLWGRSRCVMARTGAMRDYGTARATPLTSVKRTLLRRNAA
jgi:diguanylate cyclase (GGDEF)-like protein